ncbi:MAG TPA: sugar phosphate nucleotidyltransferase [Thermoanaerobaculia bacterium]|nr:sugar phosphate nucleotidyltransferase [Thermoanaerobaculia bacterium]HUM28788.1 sugar phosphate nucleotidyltransferase [Thermoanaerobaculia bacterium]HXK69045.1 sugar phosphate nucleotidyltransferase [Thermoanaerobaculia bacterium]
MQSDIVTLVLGGGAGSRLFPLTNFRAKPAVPIGGAYRLIDIPLSNAINSDFRRIFVITQFNSESLNRHVAQTYQFDHFSSGYVDILAASLSQVSDWYKGTADAVRQNLHHLEHLRFNHVLILSGDHLYRMDYRDFFITHLTTDADVTIAGKMMPRERSSAFGVIGSKDGTINRFYEKPDPDAIAHLGDSIPMSMGIYIFKRKILEEVLANNEAMDFGQHILPSMVQSHKLVLHPFDDFWEDVGTIRSYYDVNLMLTSAQNSFRMLDPDWPFFSRPRFLPVSNIRDSVLNRVLVGEGGMVDGSKIEDTSIGLRSVIQAGCTISKTLILGNDYYESEVDSEPGIPTLGIGKGCVIHGAIIDKNARVGEGSILVNRRGVKEEDGDFYHIRDGIVIIPKSVVIPPGSEI